MAAKKSGCLGTITSTIFTSIVAPVLVAVTTHHLDSGQDKGSPGEVVRTTDAVRWTVPAGIDAEASPITVQGVGSTPAEALRDAVGKALRKAVAGMLTADGWAGNWRVVRDVVLGKGDSLILRCEDLGCRKEREQGRDVYRKTVAVVVARRALAERLKAVRVRLRDEGDWSRPDGSVP